MRAFAELFQALDATTAQSAKLAALVAYLRVAAPGDAASAASSTNVSAYETIPRRTANGCFIACNK